MKVYVGSLNNVKVTAVKNVLAPFGYEVIGMFAESYVSNQPKTIKETLDGAKNRALALPKDGLRIGLEAGVMMIDDKLYLINYGVLIGENNRIYTAGGFQIELPDAIKKAIFEEHLELSDAMEAYFKIKDIKHQGGAIAYFTNDLVKRIEIFEAITKMLYGQYLRGIK